MQDKPHDMPDALRLFAAVALPSEIKNRVAKLIADLRKGTQFTAAHPTWVRPEGVHQTLVFFGNQPAQRVEAIRRAMAAAAAGQPPFELSLSRVELFPNPRNPRVICLNLFKGIDALKQLQKRMAQACKAEGFEIEEREFRPHLTLARIKSSRGLAGLRDLTQSHGGFRTEAFAVDSIVLYRSVLKPEGAEYSVVHEEPLAG